LGWVFKVELRLCRLYATRLTFKTMPEVHLYDEWLTHRAAIGSKLLLLLIVVGQVEEPDHLVKASERQKFTLNVH
jgi:hypothetical protein